MEIGPDPVDMMIGFSHYDAAQRGDFPSFAQGCRRIGFLGARMDPRVQRRLDGYRAAMKDAGLFDQRLIVTTAVPTSVTLGGTLFADLLAPRRRISMRCSAPMTTSRSACCSNAGAGTSSVPEQMAIVGFNDLEFMASAVPTLTSVRTNRYEMGRDCRHDGDRGDRRTAARSSRCSISASV